MKKTKPLPNKENEFAQRLRQLRLQKNLSQLELAQLANLHNTLIARYENGVSRPNTDTLKRLANTLGVTSDYLIEGKTQDAFKVDFQDKDLLLRFQEAEKLSDEDKAVVIKFLDAFLAKKQIQALVSR